MKSFEIDFLKSILLQVSNATTSEFTGVGLILYKTLKDLPISGLRKVNPEGIVLPSNDRDRIVSIINSLNTFRSNYHDGFHLISEQGDLTHLCQYFSPPICDGVTIDYTKGGRFRAAQYGSCLNDVLAVGVIGQIYGPFIFIEGKTIQL